MALIQKAFSDIITFSRSSNATRVGPTGVLEYAPHNLQTYSEQFDNAAWVKSNMTVTANAAAAPNGTVTAEKIVASSGLLGQTTQSINKAASAITYTCSVFAKAGEWNWFQIALFDGSADGSRFWFDLSTGVVGSTAAIGAGFTNISRSIISLGNGWYRCQCTFTTSTTTQISPFLYPTNGDGGVTAGDGTSGIYIWGAQLAVGPYALDYTPTTSAAVYGPRFDYDGSGVTIVEPVSTNLFTYSEQLNNVIWSTAGNVTITANAAVAPDGTTTADTMTEVATNATHRIEYITSGTSVANQYTVSFYVKVASGAPWFRLSFTDVSGAHQVNAWFDLTNGVNGSTSVVGSGVIASRSITAVGNGWYRCVMTGTVTGGTGVVYSYNGLANADLAITYLGSTSRAVYLWGAQLEVGSTATAYMVSGTTNGFRAVPVVSGSATPKGLLVEEQRQNLVTYSEQFDNAAWSLVAATVSANAGVSPDGTVSADKLIPNTSNSNHLVRSGSIAVSGSTGTYSLLVKTAGYSKVGVRESGTTGNWATFNLSTGAVIASSGVTNVSIAAFGNGWYKISATNSAANQQLAIYALNDAYTSGSPDAYSFSGDGTSGILIWGAQLEAGSFATSYIPTLASAVTRTADVASVNTLSPWYSATEGTLFLSYSTFAQQNTLGNNMNVLALSDGTANNRIRFTTGASVNFDVAVSGVAQASLGSTWSANTTLNWAGSYKLNDFAFSSNGASALTDTSGTIPSVTQMEIGELVSNRNMSGYIRRIAYYPRRLTNAELQALTA